MYVKKTMAISLKLFPRKREIPHGEELSNWSLKKKAYP